MKPCPRLELWGDAWNGEVIRKAANRRASVSLLIARKVIETADVAVTTPFRPDAMRLALCWQHRRGW
jgi:hypothetical protein